MIIMTNYVDLVRKINILERQLEVTEAELSYWFGRGDLMFAGEGAAKYGMIPAMENIDTLHKKKFKILKMLEFYKEVEKEIKERIDELDGLEYKIAKLRLLDGLSYKEISEKLGYSYGYIRNKAQKMTMM